MYWERRSAVINSIFERTITRHELQASPNPTLMMEFMTGPILARLLVSGQPLAEAFATTIVDPPALYREHQCIAFRLDTVSVILNCTALGIGPYSASRLGGSMPIIR